MIAVTIPLAVHISDGVLSWPWLLGGFVVAGLLAFAAAWRIRDEEIPRVALMTAAFFVASLIHVRPPLFPSSVHLLLNGLLGVVLGRRAPLAVLVGVGLQALLLGHGGVTAVGVNACVMAVPCLVAGLSFSVLARERWMRRPWRRFTIGFVVGAGAVLATTALTAAVLIFGAAEDVRTVATLVFLAHLPIVAIEGVVLGFTVSFLYRVKPEMLAGGARRLECWADRATNPAPISTNGQTVAPAPGVAAPRPPALLLALVGLLWVSGTAHAHRLEASHQALADGRVQIESWFDLTGDSAKGAKVQVFRPDGSAAAEGAMDENGVFVFRPAAAEDLRVVVSAGVGHRKEIIIPKVDLEKNNSAPAPDGLTPEARPSADRSPQVSVKDVLLGVSFVLAAAAFVLSLRNHRRLRELLGRGGPSNAVNTHFSAGKTSSSGTSH
jgi:cobalt/nickel transport system permease protein